MNACPPPPPNSTGQPGVLARVVVVWVPGDGRWHGYLSSYSSPYLGPLLLESPTTRLHDSISSPGPFIILLFLDTDFISGADSHHGPNQARQQLYP